MFTLNRFITLHFFFYISGKVVIPAIRCATVEVHMTLAATWFVESHYKSFNFSETIPK